MQKWIPDTNEHSARRIGKTLEELGELSAVLARISIQGLDAIDPASGKTNRQRMQDELADVTTQLELNVYHFNLDQYEIRQRCLLKAKQMAEWEAHFNE